jgi:hypothetical protein
MCLLSMIYFLFQIINKNDLAASNNACKAPQDSVTE